MAVITVQIHLFVPSVIILMDFIRKILAIVKVKF